MLRNKVEVSRMNFNEADIQTLTFRKRSFGYSKTDVQDFLKRVGEDYLYYEYAMKERAGLEAELDTLEEKCKTYKEILSIMTEEKIASIVQQEEIESLEEKKEELRKMQEVQLEITQVIEEKEKEILENARKKADEMIVQAEEKIERLIQKAKKQLEAIETAQGHLEN